MLEQVIDSHAEEVVGRQQADTGRDYAVAVVIGVAGKGDVVAILEADQPLHGMAGRGVHADLAVPVQAHEGELRVNDLADHLQIEPIALGDPRPVMHARAAQRVDAQAQAGSADNREIDHAAQITDIVRQVIMRMGGGRLARLGQRHALDLLEAVFEQGIGAVLHPVGDVAVGRAAIARVVLEAAAVRRVVRRGDHDAVGQARAAAAVVHQNGVGDRRCRGELAAGGHHGLHAIGGQHFERRVQRRLRQGMTVGADKQRASDAPGVAVIADRLADGEHVPLVEAGCQRTAAMPRGAEGHTLRGHTRIGLQIEVSGQQLFDIDQHGGGCRLAGQWMDA
ncbi:hypothetical protein FQZ97_681240 [compost metagenome]